VPIKASSRTSDVRQCFAEAAKERSSLSEEAPRMAATSQRRSTPIRPYRKPAADDALGQLLHDDAVLEVVYHVAHDAVPAHAVLPRSESAISTADTPLACYSPHCWPDCKEWPAHREVRGEMTLKSSANHRQSMRAVCSVRHGVLTMSVRSAGKTAEVVEVPVGELAVGLQKKSIEMFTVATLPKNRMYDAQDEIYCFVDNQVKRNKWIAVFRRMGVPIFDLQSYGLVKA